MSFIFWSTAVHQLQPQTASRITPTLPAPDKILAMWVNSSHHVIVLPHALFHHRSNLGLTSIPNDAKHSHSCGEFHLLAAPSAPHAAIFARSRTPFRAMLLCFHVLFTKGPLFFWFRLAIITIVPICHLAMKGCRILQRRVHILSFLLALICAISPLYHLLPPHPPSRCLPRQKTIEMRHFLLLLLSAMRLDMLDFLQNSFLLYSAHNLPGYDPHISIVRSWASALPFSSPKPVNDTFLVHMTSGGPNNPYKETKEGCLTMPI